MPLKLFKRGRSETYYVRGTVKGQSVYESSGTSDPQQAEEYRAKREAELWQESIYGKRAVVTFAHAVAAYVEAEPRSEATKAYL
ncbi:MAG: site-specific integrase, partial [Gluconobacter oxydans]